MSCCRLFVVVALQLTYLLAHQKYANHPSEGRLGEPEVRGISLFSLHEFSPGCSTFQTSLRLFSSNWYRTTGKGS